MLWCQTVSVCMKLWKLCKRSNIIREFIRYYLFFYCFVLFACRWFDLTLFFCLLTPFELRRKQQKNCKVESFLNGNFREFLCAFLQRTDSRSVFVSHFHTASCMFWFISRRFHSTYTAFQICTQTLALSYNLRTIPCVLCILSKNKAKTERK